MDIKKIEKTRDFYRYPWESIRAKNNSTISMNIHRYPWKPKDSYNESWISIDINRNPEKLWTSN